MDRPETSQVTIWVQGYAALNNKSNSFCFKQISKKVSGEDTG